MKLKKKPALLLFLLLGGCTALDNNFSDKNSIYSELGKITLESNRVLNENRMTRTLTNEEIKLVLDQIKDSWTRGEIVEALPESSDNIYEIQLGQYLKISNFGIKRVEVIGADSSHYEILNRDGIYFRAIYSGEYILKLDKIDGSYSVLKVKNNVKYDFTESETYDIILNNYNVRNYSDSLKGIDLYRILYPKSYRNREIDFLELELLLLKGDFKGAKELQLNLKSKGNPSFKELTALFRNELKLNGYNYNVEDYYIKNSEIFPEFTSVLKDHILGKNIKTPSEKKFIEDLYFRTSDPSLKIYVEESIKNSNQFIPSYLPMDHLEGTDNELKDSTTQLPKENLVEANRKYFTLGATAYERGRYSEAIVQLEKIPQSGRDSQTYYFLGDSYFKNEKYEKSIENYSKYIQSSEESIKKAEIRYNLAVAYDRIGNKKEAEAVLKKVIELFPGTSWSRKSNIYMIKLKNN